MRVYIEVTDDNGSRFAGEVSLEKKLSKAIGRSSANIILSSSKEDKGKGGKQSLTKYIIKLREEGFFKQPQTANEVHEKLKGFYHCELNRVSVALVRLGMKKALRKATKKIADKNYAAYTW